MFQHKVDQVKPIMFQQDIDQGYIKHGEMFHPTYVSLQKQPFLLALRRWRRFARKNVCDLATEIPYWWRTSMFT